MSQRIWLITGVSSGLGQALADQVISSGDFVVGTVRRENQIDTFYSRHGASAKAVLFDVGKDDPHRMVEKVVDELGGIDILVNNAGVGFAGGVEEASEEELRYVMEVNFFGLWRLTRAVLPLMRNKRSGHIIQISSHAGVTSFAGFGIYSASKFAVEGMSEALAQEIKPLGIRLTIVEPGPFRTNFAGKGLLLPKNVIKDYDETAGAFVKKLQSVHTKQEGSPVKAAKAILHTVDDPNATLRLPLGKIPLITISTKAGSLLDDIESNREIAEGAVYS